MEDKYRQHKDKKKKTKYSESLWAREVFSNSQQFLQSIIGSSPFPTFIIGKDHLIIYWNKALEELSGIKSEEVVGTGQQWRAFYKTARPCMADLLVDKYQEEIPQWYAGKFIKSELIDGAYEATDFFPELGENGRWLRFTASVVRNSGGDIIGAIETLEDITQAKIAEESLRKSESKYRNIFENALEGIYQVTLEGKFITANANLARMAGYDSPEDLMESIKDIKTQLYVHPEDRDRFLKIMRAKGSVKGFEVEWYKKDRNIFWVVLNALAIKDEQGNILYNEGLIEDITLRKHAEEQLHQSLESLKRAVGTTIHVLVAALEARDPYTAGHQSRSANLACAIATEMGLDKDRIEGIRMASIIHDIGKLSIPVEILTKPTKLTDLEFSLIKEHAQSGYEMLKDVESPWPLADIVLQHHERINGSGYPRKLKKDKIIIEARIMAVADVVEAMASHRPYRASLGIEVALEEIEKNKGILYDETVANACLRLFRGKGYQLQ